MNIQQIKAAINSKHNSNITTLMMVQQKDQAGVLQPWVSYWDNDSRIRVTIHLDTFNDLKANPTQDGLAFKEQLVPAKDDRAAYTRYVVIKPANVLATF